MSDLNEQESEFERLLEGAPFDDAPRPEHAQSLRREVLARLDAVEPLAMPDRRRSKTWKNLLIQGRDLMRRPIPRLVAVSAVCLVIGAVWLLVPGRQSTAQAFNKLAEALVTAKTARFEMQLKAENFKFDGKTLDLFGGKPQQKVQSYFLAPARYRNELRNSVTIADWTPGHVALLMLMPASKEAMLMKLKGEQPKDRKDQKFQNPFQQLRDLLAQTRDAKESQYRQIGEKEINGRRAIGFRYDSPAASLTLWGDPATGDPVEIDTIYTGIPGTEVVMSHFEINVELSPSLFEMTPPAGYRLRSFDVDVSPTNEQSLIAALEATSDLGDGMFPDSLNSMGIMQAIMKRTMRGMQGPPTSGVQSPPVKGAKEAKGPSDEEIQRLMQQSVAMGRGFQFALDLPESADAHYAGSGVKRNTKDRPIFWYKPEGQTAYHVIFADLSVKEAQQPPQVAGAVRIGNPASTKAK